MERAVPRSKRPSGGRRQHPKERTFQRVRPVESTPESEAWVDATERTDRHHRPGTPPRAGGLDRPWWTPYVDEAGRLVSVLPPICLSHMGRTIENKEAGGTLVRTYSCGCVQRASTTPDPSDAKLENEDDPGVAAPGPSADLSLAHEVRHAQRT
jgi:hypothetical protein